MANVCGCSGKPLDGITTDFGYRRPMHYFMVPEAERAARIRESDDLCSIDDKIFLIRGVMRIPIIDASVESFGWGMWAQVGQRSFYRYVELFDADAREEPALKGALANSPPIYPDMIDAPVSVHLGTPTQRPEFHPTSFEHPLFREVRDGISVQRWRRIVTELEMYQGRTRH